MAKTGWESYNLEHKVATCNTAQLLMLFKEIDKELDDKSGQLLQVIGKLTEEGKREFTIECNNISKARDYVAVKIAEALTKEK